MNRIQYTIRGVSERLDGIARSQARRDGRSLNETLLAALQKGLGLSGERVRYSDLDDLAGTWIDDPEFDRVIREMDRIDQEQWK